MDEERWPAEWLRGVLELCVLAVLEREHTYGYVIAQRLAEAGLGSVKGGTLYPLLARLERDGLAASSWAPGQTGPGRKYVEISDAGRAELRRRTHAWRRFVAGTERLLPPEPDHSDAVAIDRGPSERAVP